MKHLSLILTLLTITLSISSCKDNYDPISYQINNSSDYDLKIVGYSAFDKSYNDTVLISSYEIKELFYRESKDIKDTERLNETFTNIYDSLLIYIDNNIAKNYHHEDAFFDIENWNLIQDDDKFDAYYYLTNDSFDLLK